ncbi:MAG: 50S ribosomal protein L13 [Candidatus Nealsonbacteria bacterium CG_4_10_14_0_2_um_filter_40_15]|uniref:Large ribosomal subunit protein uL13 n=1 Tax=Candidatus Nealsonbacteria bacterium CG_4_10_14_0_2_um_filter_40_15 TaxID=1974682 RepID=A0A2M7UUB8_9BACT|nr:MAG: 50S ribosomal protein L13 [Candidatus Nealsonbacteria bacterium CG_4_10_14_0_2_um_filter_40_15]
MEPKTHTIDATGRILGRLAAEITILLRGKNKPEFVPYKDVGDFVTVKNAGKMKFTGKKLEQKKYFRHSKYLGGVKEIPLKKLFSENPAEVLRKAVYGMLPRNKLRAKMMRKLKIEK